MVGMRDDHGAPPFKKKPPTQTTMFWYIHLLVVLACILASVHSSLDPPNTRTTGSSNEEEGGFLVGTGIYDITGPAATINFMGYAKATQNAHGIHQRLRARAFIISEVVESYHRHHHQHHDHHQSSSTNVNGETFPVHPKKDDENLQIARRERFRGAQWKNININPPPRPLDHPHDDDVEEVVDEKHNHASSLLDPEKTVCFVSIDTGMGSDLLNLLVLERLQELLPPSTTTTEKNVPDGGGGKRLCHLENLSISGTHTHSAPGGFIQYALYQMTSLGISHEVLEAYAEGTAQAIKQAYDNLQPATIRAAQDLIFNANINRSPSSYLLNPQSERDEYDRHEGDTDKTMLQLAFETANDDDSGRKRSAPLGVLNWFAVHGTSMNSTNRLISGDNKGYASYLMEKHYNVRDSLPGNGPFVAAFASTNLGDVSPNTAGPKCLDTGLPCDFTTSTCNGQTGMCVASGPGKDMFESTEIIGRKQYEMAVKLLENTTRSQTVSGRVRYRHSFVDMSQLNVTLVDGRVVQTCPAALGYSFAAGTTDGVGEFDFSQGMNTSNPFWNMIGGFLSVPSEEQVECQAPKPILLNTGRANLPYAWDPNTIPISIFQIGKVFILSVPSEFTTMAGRRLRKAVAAFLQETSYEENPIITIAGLANSYTHYVTTEEEYAGQRYEAASTLYGPHTLAAYIQEFQRLASDLVEGQPSTTSEAPRDLSKQQISLIPPVEMDMIGLGRSFGSVVSDANDAYNRTETVMVKFRSANPRNNQRIQGTFLTVEMLDQDGKWQTIYNDGDWCTKFIWQSDGTSGYLAISFTEIHWTIPSDTEQGIYRICHEGTRKTFLGEIVPLMYYVPDWLAMNLLGSTAVNFMAQMVRFAWSLSSRVRHFFSILDVNRYKYTDFVGCSKPFLVIHGDSE